jgi:transposase
MSETWLSGLLWINLKIRSYRKSLYSKQLIKADTSKKDIGGDEMRYSTDITDSQWELIWPLFERKNNTGKHLENQDKRELVNAVLYINKTGCQWRLLPKDFPNYSTVSSFYHRAIASGLWDRICALLVRKSRVQAGRKPEPTYALQDSQSVKTTGASEERGYDGGKKSKGGKGTS